jgi:hypothetical protein
MATRYNINDFALANPAYVGGTVSFWTVSGGAKTATLATLYAASTGSTTLANPRTLDSDGKFSVPVYVEVPTIATVSGLTIADHDTGIMGLAEGAASTSAAAAVVSAAAAFVSQSAAGASAAAALVSENNAAATLAGALLKAGGNMTGGINSARGNITQHATTMDFFATTSPDILDGTGSAVTITACVNAPQAGATRKFYPIAATVLTHGATFDCVGNANLTAAAGDCWIIEAKTVSTYRVSAVKEDGTAAVVSVTAMDQTARDQIALTNIRLMLTSAIATGELVQGKQWELATDEWGATSTNETYNAPGALGYYNNNGGYTADQVPTMSSETAPSGTVTKSTELSGTQAAWKAFDKSGATYWQPSTTGTEWVAYDWGSGKTITQYTLKCAVNAVNRGPSAWTFDGWNGSSWVTLHTGSETAWTVGQLRTYAVSNSTAYNKYRINMTAIAGGAAAYEITEIAMMESVAPPNMTLIPPASTTVSAAPDFMDAYALWKDDSGSASLGTDLTIELSRDGGTTYTTGTVSNLASYDGTYSIIKGRADVGAQPSGTSMLCRIKTLNNKAQRIGAPALYAE